MTYPRLITVFKGEGFEAPCHEMSEGGVVRVVADMDIDVDGSGLSHGDPYFQPDTSLHYKGKALNSDADKYIVVPLEIVKGVKGIVLGCQVHVVDSRNGRSSLAVVGDVGPTRKIGEASRLLAMALGINPDPVRGGVDWAVILYEITPGIPAMVDGRKYTLQPYHG